MLYNEHNTCTLHRGSAARDGGHDGHGIRAHIIPMRTLGIWQNFILRFSEYIFRNGATDDNSTPYAVEGWLFCCYTLFFLLYTLSFSHSCLLLCCSSLVTVGGVIWAENNRQISYLVNVCMCVMRISHYNFILTNVCVFSFFFSSYIWLICRLNVRLL